MSKRYAIILTKLGEHLRKIRERKGLTLQHVYVNCGINEGDISRIENGKINVSYSTLCRLAVGLKMTPRELFEELDWDPEWTEKLPKEKKK